MCPQADTGKGSGVEGELSPELAGLAAAVWKAAVEGPGTSVP